METVFWVVGIVAIFALCGWFGLRWKFPPDT